LNQQYTYFAILAASIAGPLLLSFDKKVAFYKQWKYVFPAMLLPALFYILWDIFFTEKGVWSFNEQYITGIKLHNLPVEEVLFFVVVPYCCIFIYACVRAYFPNIKNRGTGDLLFQIIAVAALLFGILQYDKYYTGYTFLLLAVFIAIYYIFRSFFKGFSATYFLIAYAIILLPFLFVNGLLTAIPVVLYNNDENMSLRIYTIPFEDVFYGMLLVFLNILMYEKLKYKSTMETHSKSDAQAL